MDTLIGLGQAGCNIVESLSQYPQYKCYYIDSEQRHKDNFFPVDKQRDCEKYENNCPSFNSFFKGISRDVLLVVGGSGAISGLSLRILNEIKDNNLNVLYIQPDLELLSELGRKQEKVVYNVLQQYTMSKLFKNLFLVSNPVLEKIVEKISILNYHKQLNELITSAFHMINIFNHTDSVMDTFASVDGAVNIATFGIIDVKQNEQKLFFPLDNLRELRYYYAINREELEREGNLLANVKKNIKESTNEDIRASYGIYTSKYEQNYGYVVAYSSQLQK
jgi:hypothetical protein